MAAVHSLLCSVKTGQNGKYRESSQIKIMSTRNSICSFWPLVKFRGQVYQMSEWSLKIAAKSNQTTQEWRKSIHRVQRYGQLKYKKIKKLHMVKHRVFCFSANAVAWGLKGNQRLVTVTAKLSTLGATSHNSYILHLFISELSYMVWRSEIALIFWHLLWSDSICCNWIS